MNAAERREAILSALSSQNGPVSASHLAQTLSVSRQIIVGDVALLRAGGADIIATPRGYILSGSHAGIRRRIACCHTSTELEEEMNIIVDNGCTIEDVIVEHPIYGQLTGLLQVSSRYDVSSFIREVSSQEAKPLSVLTNGIHLHTITCPDEDAFQRVRQMLRDRGFLVAE